MGISLNNTFFSFMSNSTQIKNDLAKLNFIKISLAVFLELRKFTYLSKLRNVAQIPVSLSKTLLSNITILCQDQLTTSQKHNIWVAETLTCSYLVMATDIPYGKFPWSRKLSIKAVVT